MQDSVQAGGVTKVMDTDMAEAAVCLYKKLDSGMRERERVRKWALAQEQNGIYLIRYSYRFRHLSNMSIHFYSFSFFW